MFYRKALARMESKLDLVLQEIRKMSANVDANFLALQAQVSQNTSVEGSALTLIQGFAAQLAAAVAAANNGDSNALPALTASLNSSATALAAAVAQNTTVPPVTTGTAT
jgi:hypothetical protein